MLLPIFLTKINTFRFNMKEDELLLLIEEIFIPTFYLIRYENGILIFRN